MDAAQLAERLASDSAEDRSAAYAVIEATQDVGPAALPAEPLAGTACLAAYLKTKTGVKIAKYAM